MVEFQILGKAPVAWVLDRLEKGRILQRSGRHRSADVNIKIYSSETPSNRSLRVELTGWGHEGGGGFKQRGVGVATR